MIADRMRAARRDRGGRDVASWVLAGLACALMCCAFVKRVQAQALEPAPEPPAEPESAPEAAPAPAPQAAPEPEPTLGATARVTPEAAGETRVPAEEARDAPGTIGDPLRVLDAMPGVVPIASGLPYGYVRGAPPATVGYAYDDIPLPELYHFALGPSVIHPRMLGPLNFYPGVPPARFGRRLGGELAVDAPPESAQTTGELELRLLDVNGFVQVPVDGGTFAVAGRYGYPGPLLRIISPNTALDYWDYQTRLDLPLSSHARFQVVGLGSFDSLSHPPWSQQNDRFQNVALQFHRLELRVIQRFDNVEFGSALRLGVDRSSIDRDLRVDAFTMGPRVWVDVALGSRARLHSGADFQASVGNIQSQNMDAPLEIAGRRQVRFDLPLIADAAARSAGGVFVELGVRPTDWSKLDVGLRSDLWLVDGRSDAALDPRLRYTVYVGSNLALHAAVGMAHQPAVYAFPLPGLTEVALDRGLQESLQAEIGAALRMPWDLQLEAELFAHHYTRLMLPELYAPNEGESPPHADALSYGLELMLRRESRGGLRGWIGYTLGWADARVGGSGTTFSPEFDVRHVLNLVLEQRFGGGFAVGARLFWRSSRPFNQFDANFQPVYELRLPGFARIDARVGYSWTTSWGAMQVYLEWLNVTLDSEVLGAECFYGRCSLQRAPVIFFPNAGARAQF
jgi:hypothetical protein